MMLPKSKQMFSIRKTILYLIPLLLLISSKGFAIPMNDNEIKYHILNTESDYINMGESSVEINTLDKVINLKKLAPTDIIKFTNTGDFDFVVLGEGGLNHYAFNGIDYSRLSSLEVPNLISPYGIAVKTSSDGYTPNYYISEVNPDAVEGEHKISSYYYDATDGMKESPMLQISGMGYITSMSTFKDSGDIALLNGEGKFIISDNTNIVFETQLNVAGPISLATGSGYHFSILSGTKVEHYMYDGNSFNTIPILEVLVDEEITSPKSIAITDDTTYILDDDEVRAYSFDGVAMNYNVGLSVTGLVKPQAMAFNSKNNNLVVIDVNSDGVEPYKTRYFMLSENGYVENLNLSVKIDNLISSGSYAESGVLNLGSFTSSSAYINLIRVRAYTETPKGTSIKFQVSSSNDGVGVPIWKDAWVVSNTDTVGVDGLLSKFNDDGSTTIFGSNEHGFPTFQNIEVDYGNDDGYEIGLDIDGNPIIIDPSTYNNTLWTRLPKVEPNGNIVNVRAILSTTDSSVSPKIFAPLGVNNTKGILDVDDVAIHIEANALPEKPTIIDIGPEDPVPPQTPGVGEMGFDPMPGWVYTTTPRLTWDFQDIDTGFGQSAYQVMLLAKGVGGWEIIDNSNLINNTENSYTVTTSYDNAINGTMWDSNAYEFGIAVRVWDDKGGISEFSEISTFKVLAFERPRIANIIYPPEDYEEFGITAPKLDLIDSHKMIKNDDDIEDLSITKAGSQVTLLIDSVGPIESLPLENAFFYVEIGGVEHKLKMADSYYINPLGLNSNRNRWVFNFYTEAPIIDIPDNTLVKARIAGRGEIGGTTIFYLPNYSEGVIRTKGTIYSDWQVIIQGRDR